MKLEILGLLALASLPNTVAADDLASQLAAADAAFLGTTVSGNALEQRQFIAQMLADLTCTWITASGSDPSQDLLNLALLLDYCNRPPAVFEFTAPTPYRFLMTRTYDSNVELVYQYDYMGSNRFQLRVDIQEYLTYFEVPDDEEARANAVHYRPGLFGAYALFHPSPDVLVLLPENREADIYLRCPE